MNTPIRLLVAGHGLDGELPLDDLRGLLGPIFHTFTARDTETISSVLEWHPSEATGMLAAAARGVRGTCEVRDAGLPVPLTDEGPVIHEADIDEALSHNQLARAVMTTATLGEVETYSREICGYSEIDYERNKAAWLSEQFPSKLDPDAVLTKLDHFETEAHNRGVTHTTFRHLTEALSLNGNQRQDLRELLINSRPGQYAAPLWSVTP